MNGTYIGMGILLLAVLAASCGAPIARFSLSEDITYPLAPALIPFVNESEHADSYFWDFGDGQSSTEAMPMHRYANSGRYEVRLEVRKGERVDVFNDVVLVGPPVKCLVEIETDYGNMVVQLYDSTPEHRDNFVKLASEGFYDDQLFHRVIAGFMLQAGDPKSRNAKPDQALGSGGPGYTLPAEFVDSLVHLKGMLAAARTPDDVNPEKRSSGSQFYIVQGRPQTEESLNDMEGRTGFRYSTFQREAYLKYGGAPQLDGQYTIFGRVIEGLDVIDKIADQQTGPGDRPVEDIRIKVRPVY
ncbi:MAG: peptidylprolyl isomerase [Saprospiraceae bacterium]|nr:peptidylprolyl isomerase [Saprospiraceae bacterium]